MKLVTLLQNIIDVTTNANVEVNGLSVDSRCVKKGDLFFAYPGELADGRKYINDAINNGAVIIIAEKSDEFKIDKKSVPIIFVTNLRHKIGFIASRFYQDPSKAMTIIGITGTNGKTSICQYLSTILTQQNYLCASMGTLGVGFPGKLTNLINTTPDPVIVQQQLAELRDAGAKAVAMEVTSQGLVQSRVNGVHFDIAVFTNLSRDHLDLHGSMENYAKAKHLLFDMPDLKHAVINVDDDYGRELFLELEEKMPVIGFSMQHHTQASVTASEVVLTEQGVRAKLTTPWGDGRIQSSILGRFNLSNMLAVISVLGLMKIPLANSLKSLAQLTTTSGRMQTLGGGKYPLVVVDYAHTPDALKQVLLALREHCQGKLWCVFGCGGDRDRGKRPQMGKIAEQYSDQIIITDDNPRTEDPVMIVNEIVDGLLCPWAAEIEHDRASAIAHAIECADGGDVILVAGKGHEDYQIIGTEKLPFYDVDVVEQQLKSKVS